MAGIAFAVTSAAAFSIVSPAPPGAAQGIAQQSSPPRWTITPSPNDPRLFGGFGYSRLRNDALPLQPFDAATGFDAPEMYTTMCVRMCDGYYFPISHRVSRSRLHDDADVCRSRCSDSVAQLFYFPAPGGSMHTAVDLNGRGYASLPIAFQHRKRLVAGCTCRPEPWSEGAKARHHGYALAEGVTLVGGSAEIRGGTGSLEIVAGGYREGDASSPSDGAPAHARELSLDAPSLARSADPMPLQRRQSTPAWFIR